MTKKPSAVAIASDFITAVRDHGIHLFEFRANPPKFSVGETLPVKETWRRGVYGNIELKADCSPYDLDGWEYTARMPLWAAKRSVYVKSISKITPDEFREQFGHSWAYGQTSFGCLTSDLPDTLWFRDGTRLGPPDKNVYAVEYEMSF